MNIIVAVDKTGQLDIRTSCWSQYRRITVFQEDSLEQGGHNGGKTLEGLPRTALKGPF